MKEWIKKMLGRETLDWDQYKKLITDREYLDFVSHNTLVSAKNLRSKGL